MPKQALPSAYHPPSSVRFALASLVLLIVACAEPGAPPVGAGPEDRIYPTPVFYSERPRPANVTYSEGRLQQNGSDVTVDFVITNGYSRVLEEITIYVTLFGRSSERLVHIHPMGAMSPQFTRRSAAKIKGVGFEVKRFELGVVKHP